MIVSVVLECLKHRTVQFKKTIRGKLQRWLEEELIDVEK